MADDTPNSILTAAQRDFLKKSEEERKTDYSRQSRSHHRREIAKRTRQAFHDFALLYEVLDELERNRIFDIGPLHDNVDEHNEFQDALASTVAFLYRSLEGEPATLANWDETRTPEFRVPFEHVLTEGLKRGEADRYNQNHATKHRIKVDYGGVELVEGGDPAALERGLRKLADRKHHELTEAEMSGILYHYEPDGPLDILDGDGGYNRLNERVKELREQSNDGDDSPDE